MPSIQGGVGFTHRNLQNSIAGVVMEWTIDAQSKSLEELLTTYAARDVNSLLAKEELIRRMQALPDVVPVPHTDEVGRCGFCGTWFRFDGIRVLIAHTTHGRRTGVCPHGFTPEHKCDCGRTFESVDRAEKHMVFTGSCLHVRLKREKELKALYCEPCGHQTHTKKDFAKHCATKAHHKVTNPDEFLCVPCEHRSRCATEHQAHLQSKGHRTIVEAGSLTCEPCGIVCRGKYEYDRHCEGKQHRFKTDPSARPTLTCTLCGITRPSQAQYQAHLQTAKHRKKEAEQQACPEDPVSPDDEDASGSPDTRAPSPAHSPPLAC